MAASLLAAADPAGGAALDQVAIATAMAGGATLLLGLLLLRHARGRGSALERASSFAARAGGIPGWAALPNAVAGLALQVALVGMYWDIALHIDDGRDAGPLANPAHYLILAGLYGVFAAGLLAVVLGRGESTGPAAVRLPGGWHAPVGGVLMSAAAAFALIGFPLDDLWHRIFGQDVTLWGPTHLMLIGGAALSLVGQCVLLMEGVRAKGVRRGRRASTARAVRGVALMGGLLVGLSTFQAEFDFGVPQFAATFQPVLVALAAGLGLVCARIWIGRGGALGAVLFFLVLRGLVSLFVGATGQTMPSMPLYLGEALCVELVALWLGRGRPLALGAVSGALIGTVGFATEAAWSQVALRLPWTDALVPEALPLAVVAGVAGGLLGGLLGAALRGDLPRPAAARGTLAAALVAVAVVVGAGLATTGPGDLRAAVTLTPSGPGQAVATVRLTPPDAADDARWLNVTAWQGGGLVVQRLERLGDGVFRSEGPVPVAGAWKTLVRLHAGRALLGAPIHLPADAAIPAPAVPARANVERAFVDETSILQRELEDDVPAWLWSVASAVVLALALAFLGVLAWGLGRVARRGGAAPPPRPPAPPRARAVAVAS